MKFKVGDAVEVTAPMWAVVSFVDEPMPGKFVYLVRLSDRMVTVADDEMRLLND